MFSRLDPLFWRSPIGVGSAHQFSADSLPRGALLAPGDPGITKDVRDSAGGLPGRIDYWWQESNDPRALATEIWLIKTARSDHHALMIGVHIP